MKILFWVFAGIDAAAFLGFIGFALLFALGSKSNPLASLGMALGLLLIGGVVVGGPMLLFLRSKSHLGRVIALLLVLLPAMLVGVSAALQALEGDDRDHFDVSGRLIHFRSGRPRALESAIVSGDLATVRTLLNQVNLNQPGHQDATFLHVSVRELWRTTNQLEVLKLLLDHGADVKTRDRDGHDPLWHATTARHWPAVLCLLQRGADWKSFRNSEGLGFQATLESQAVHAGEGPGLADVLTYVRTAAQAKKP